MQVSAQRVCVFCGASNGVRPEYSTAARSLGLEIARRGATLVYGGGRAGLMGQIADGALEGGGQVVGIITTLLRDRELGHSGITQLHVVQTMHERKMMMATLADAFIALPGGLGTFDELCEILAWAQLGIHAKPVGLLNTLGFFDPLWSFMASVEREGFLRLDYKSAVTIKGTPAAMLDAVLGAGRVP